MKKYIEKIDLSGTELFISDAESKEATKRLWKRFGQLDLSGKTIFIGDSYGEGYTAIFDNTGAIKGYTIKPWENYVIENCGITDYVISCRGGSGFAVTGNTFESILDSVQIDTPESVKNIVVCGGYNEPSDINAIQTAEMSFYSKAKSKFPNAKIFCGMISWDVNSTNWDKLNKVCEAYQYNAVDWFYLNNVQYSIHSDGLMGADGFHPNETGYTKIGLYVSEALKTGSCNPSFFNVNAIIRFSPNWALTPGAVWNIVTNYDGNKSRIIWGNTILAPVGDTTIKCDGTEYLVAAIDSTSYIGDGAGYSVIDSSVIVQSGALFYNIPCQYHIMKREIYMSFYDVDDTHTNYRTLTDVKQVQIRRESLVE